MYYEPISWTPGFMYETPPFNWVLCRLRDRCPVGPENNVIVIPLPERFYSVSFNQYVFITLMVISDRFDFPPS